MEYKEMLKRALSKVRKTDETERFEVPAPEIFIQGNQTVIKNFGSIASALRRDQKHLLKFMTKELAAPGYCDGQRAFFQRVVSKSFVAKKVDNYINEFVKCRECKKPDTKLVKEGRILILKCEACGARKSVKQV